jgi:hypothetical protein
MMKVTVKVSQARYNQELERNGCKNKEDFESYLKLMIGFEDGDIFKLIITNEEKSMHTKTELSDECESEDHLNCTGIGQCDCTCHSHCPIGFERKEDCNLKRIDSYDRKEGIGIHGMEMGEYTSQIVDVYYCSTHKYQFRKFGEHEY